MGVPALELAAEYLLSLQECLQLITSSFAAASSRDEFLQLPERLALLSVLGEQLRAPETLVYHVNAV